MKEQKDLSARRDRPSQAELRVLRADDLRRIRGGARSRIIPKLEKKAT